ncbi:MAG: GNAT family N-acetyltransferase [Micavibrio sp.]
MECKVEWNGLSIDEWERRFAAIPFSNFLQSYGYARVYCPHARQKARWGLIRIDGREAGLVQIFEAGLLRNLIHAVMLDRGPLWFEGYGNAMHVKSFFAEWNRQFPPRMGRRRRILPDIEDGATLRKMLPQTGLIETGQAGYQTLWIDLTENIEVIREKLKQNWRGALNKAERAGLKISWAQDAAAQAGCLALYAADKGARGYGGIAPELLRAYMPALAARGELFLARAMGEKDGADMGADIGAFVLLASHGRSASYIAGWSGEWGRKNSAHHLLLFEAIRMLQSKGIKELDLGGINDEAGGEGIRNFKEGLGGRPVRYASMYR